MLLKVFLEGTRKGKKMTDKELTKWIDSTPEGKDFRERLKEHWGPNVEKIDKKIKELGLMLNIGSKEKKSKKTKKKRR